MDLFTENEDSTSLIGFSDMPRGVETNRAESKYMGISQLGSYAPEHAKKRIQAECTIACAEHYLDLIEQGDPNVLDILANRKYRFLVSDEELRTVTEDMSDDEKEKFTNTFSLHKKCDIDGKVALKEARFDDAMLNYSLAYSYATLLRGMVNKVTS